MSGRSVIVDRILNSLEEEVYSKCIRKQSNNEKGRYNFVAYKLSQWDTKLNYYNLEIIPRIFTFRWDHTGYWYEGTFYTRSNKDQQEVVDRVVKEIEDWALERVTECPDEAEMRETLTHLNFRLDEYRHIYYYIDSRGMNSRDKLYIQVKDNQCYITVKTRSKQRIINYTQGFEMGQEEYPMSTESIYGYYEKFQQMMIMKNNYEAMVNEQHCQFLKQLEQQFKNE